MSDDELNVEEPQDAQGQDVQEPQTFERAYVEELRNESKGRRLRIAELEKQLKDIEDAQLAKQAEWQQLAEKRAGEIQELQPYKEQYEAMLVSIAESNKKRIDSIPEKMRGLVPDFSDPVKVANWLDANAQFLSKPLAPELNGNAGDGKRPAEQVVLGEEQLKVARRLGLNPEEYKKATRT